ncbi:HAMP domain-containing protein, partial [Rhodoplanes sp. SY1]|uniref:HAMP domain-containing protein n=1 Tax=Rhodoplanes sp. SY1 TaxID=3166646 RepID=UPI0038B57616
NAVGALVILVLSALVLGLALRLVLRPLTRLRDGIAEIAAGRLDSRVPETGRTDEIGLMAQEIETLRLAAIAATELRAREDAECAEKAMRAERMARDIAAFDRTAASTADQLAAAAVQMHAAAAAMADTAADTSGRSGDAASATETATTSVQSIATATEELSATIAEITQQVEHSAAIAHRAADEAARANAGVADLATGAARI